MAIRKLSLENVKNLTFKKALMGAAIVGLVAVPSLVAAESSTTTTAGTTTQTSTTGVDGSTTPLSGSSTGTASGSTGTSSGSSSTGTSTSGTSTTNVTGTVQTPSGSTVPTDDDTTVTPNVTFEQAVTTAQATFPSKTIVRASLTEQNEAAVFVVRFSDGSWVVVDSNSGSVTSSFDASAAVKTDSDTDTDSDKPVVLPPQANLHAVKAVQKHLKHDRDDHER